MKNKYGYGLTKSHMNALRWANNRSMTAGGYFIVSKGWKRYIGMGRGTPTASVKKLFERDLVYFDSFGSKMVSNKSTGPLEVYRFTERAVLLLAEHGGYKMPDGKIVSFSPLTEPSDG